MIFTGCSSTKPEDQSYNFTPDSISNMVIQLEDDSLFELDNNQLYRVKNVNGAVIDEGKFNYRKSIWYRSIFFLQQFFYANKV